MDDDRAIHPNAPAGGGGPGHFRGASSLGMHPTFDAWWRLGPLDVVKPPLRLGTAARAPVSLAATYVVRRGDSLWAIAERLLGSGTLALDLATLNKLPPDAVLQIGQRLIVPDYQRSDLTSTWMATEMVKNARSEEAGAIDAALKRSRDMKAMGDRAIEDIRRAPWYQFLRIHASQSLLDTAIQQSGIAIIEAKTRWLIQVLEDGPWDHKWQLRKRYEAMPSPPRPFGTMDRWLHFPVRGDLLHEYFYDVWSNIHDGFAGTRCGFDAATLHAGAASGLPTAGLNDQGDVISVQIGIDLWTSAGLGLTAGQLCRAIVARAGDDQAARQAELQRGVLPDKASNVVITDNDYK